MSEYSNGHSNGDEKRSPAAEGVEERNRRPQAICDEWNESDEPFGQHADDNSVGVAINHDDWPRWPWEEYLKNDECGAPGNRFWCAATHTYAEGLPGL